MYTSERVSLRALEWWTRNLFTAHSGVSCVCVDGVSTTHQHTNKYIHKVTSIHTDQSKVWKRLQKDSKSRRTRMPAAWQELLEMSGKLYP